MQWDVPSTRSLLSLYTQENILYLFHTCSIPVTRIHTHTLAHACTHACTHTQTYTHTIHPPCYGGSVQSGKACIVLNLTALCLQAVPEGPLEQAEAGMGSSTAEG